MRGNESLERFRAHQRRVTWQYNSKLGSTHSAARNLHGVAGAVLRLLQDSLRAKRLNYRRYLLRLMAHHDNRFPCAQWRARADDVFDERASPGTV
jgi:hypothetical protein